jgi:hypothetical protein
MCPFGTEPAPVIRKRAPLTTRSFVHLADNGFVCGHSGNGNRANGHPRVVGERWQYWKRSICRINFHRSPGRRELQISYKALLYKIKQMGLGVSPSDEL